MQYNKYNARELFMNDKLAHLFPQFSQNEQLRNVYSFADTERRVQNYLVRALNGTTTADGEIVVNGQHRSVLNRVRQLQPLIEGIFNNMPKIVKAIRRNTMLYLPYATKKQMEDISTPAARVKALQAIAENLQYNTEMGALNSIKKEVPERFAKNKRAWDARVGHRRLKRI
jgi:16S rRNA G1207 methylase RsmC